MISWRNMLEMMSIGIRYRCQPGNMTPLMVTEMKIKAAKFYMLLVFALLPVCASSQAEVDFYASFFKIDSAPDYAGIAEFIKQKEQAGEIFWSSGDGATLVEWAIRLDEQEMVYRLLDLDGISHITRSMQEVFEEAIRAGNPQVVARLFDEIGLASSQEVIDRNRLLYRAAVDGKVQIAAYLVENHGASVHEMQLENPGMLSDVVRLSPMEMVWFLIKNGADIFYSGDEGWTLLHSAVALGNFELVNYLVENGIDINTRADQGITPLGAAATSVELDENPMPMLQLVVDLGADACDKTQVVTLYINNRAKYLSLDEYLKTTTRESIVRFFEELNCQNFQNK